MTNTLGLKLGDPVYIWKYGAWYRGTVTYAGPRGAVKVRFTPKNGNTKEATFAADEVRHEIRRAP